MATPSDESVQPSSRSDSPRPDILEQADVPGAQYDYSGPYPTDALSLLSHSLQTDFNNTNALQSNMEESHLPDVYAASPTAPDPDNGGLELLDSGGHANLSQAKRSAALPAVQEDVLRFDVRDAAPPTRPQTSTPRLVAMAFRHDTDSKRANVAPKASHLASSNPPAAFSAPPAQLRPARRCPLSHSPHTPIPTISFPKITSLPKKPRFPPPNPNPLLSGMSSEGLSPSFSAAPTPLGAKHAPKRARSEELDQEPLPVAQTEDSTEPPPKKQKAGPLVVSTAVDEEVQVMFGPSYGDILSDLCVQTGRAEPEVNYKRQRTLGPAESGRYPFQIILTVDGCQFEVDNCDNPRWGEERLAEIALKRMGVMGFIVHLSQ